MSRQRHTDFQEDFPSNPKYFDDNRSQKAVNQNVWQRLTRVMEVFIYVLCLLAVAKMFWPEVERQKQLNAEIANLDKVLEERQTQVNRLRQKHELLKNDRDYLEVVSRDRLNLMRTDEYVVRIERTEEDD